MFLKISKNEEEIIIDLLNDKKEKTESYHFTKKDKEIYSDSNQIFFFIKDQIWETNIKFTGIEDLPKIIDKKLKSFLTCG